MSSEALADAGVSLTNRTRMARGGYMSSIGVLHELHCLVCFIYSQLSNSSNDFVANVSLLYLL